ncbi:SDR family NAD(P)-dependent oxidoreductase [Oceanomicrobium pacificus]|uniref:SDR family oxidoreductase n=1 Tax=Oceanomicrobium pacificus TaxID=2692916 RepID=A0A6B0TV82_9RHOB|nr:SDR family NAD(P)-dependent oxidoreductase [Oceanomicrobium pacificus]MXU65044.1 SDR family oxidoreductase [Oceanomicrobium pacificus]
MAGLAADLDGKRSILTGGATGIGAAMVRAFAGQGAYVEFLDLNAEAGAKLASELGARVRFHHVDLTDTDALQACIGEIAGARGVDILVNGAANDMRHKYEDVTPDSWRSTLAVNLDHQFFCAQSVLPVMRAQKAGVILNFGSIAWREGLADAVGYVTAKAGIEGLTKSLAREAGSDGVRVNCLLPGFVRTERQVEKWLTPELEATVMERQCLPRYIEPQDIADVALFLCSDAARALTNQTIVVDAGWT